MYLYSNSDFASDVRSQYLDSLRRGAGDMEAVQQLIADYGEALMDEEDAPAFWLALAEVQWEMGRLEETVKHNAFRCIEEELARIGTQSDAVASDRKLTNVLTALKRKLLSRQPPRKQIRPYRLYRTDWKAGDVFAYCLNADETDNSAFDGQYAYFVVKGTQTWHPGHIIPVVYVYWTISNEVLDILQLRRNEYLPQFYTPAAYANNPAMRKEYSLGIICTSARSIPQKQLIYLGNIGSVRAIENEGENPYYVTWKKFDKYMIKNYMTWTQK